MSYPFSPGLIKAIMRKIFLDGYEFLESELPLRGKAVAGSAGGCVGRG